MEQVLEWLNENELRAYPLQDRPSKTIQLDGKAWDIPDNFLLDLQLITTTVQLASPSSIVSLTALSYTAPDTVYVEFGVAEDTIAGFTVQSSDGSYPIYVRTIEGSLAVFGEGLLDFVTACAGQSTSLTPNIAVEPSTCTQFDEAWLGVVNLSTYPEKVSEPVEEVSVSRSYEPKLPLLDVDTAAKLAGDVKFLAGYNFRVGINKNLIDLEIGFGYGLKMTCATPFLSEEYLDCHELVSYINGVPPDASGNFRINSGSNISLLSGNTIASNFNDSLAELANPYTLFVGLSFNATDICAPVKLPPN